MDNEELDQFMELQKEYNKTKDPDMKKQIVKELGTKADFLFDIENLSPIKHLWTDRGAKLTCENAGHTYHEVWKRQ